MLHISISGIELKCSLEISLSLLQQAKVLFRDSSSKVGLNLLTIVGVFIIQDFIGVFFRLVVILNIDGGLGDIQLTGQFGLDVNFIFVLLVISKIDS